MRKYKSHYENTAIILCAALKSEDSMRKIVITILLLERDLLKNKTTDYTCYT